MDFSNLDEVIYRFTNGDGSGRTDAFAIRQACEGVQILKPTPKSTDRQRVGVIDKVDWLLRTTVQYRLLLLPGRVNGPHGAAHLLGLPPLTLKSKLKKSGITKKYQTAE